METITKNDGAIKTVMRKNEDFVAPLQARGMSTDRQLKLESCLNRLEHHIGLVEADVEELRLLLAESGGTFDSVGRDPVKGLEIMLQNIVLHPSAGCSPRNQEQTIRRPLQASNSVPSTPRLEESIRPVSINRITPEEFNSVPRALRSNISLVSLNDALDDVEQLFNRAKDRINSPGTPKESHSPKHDDKVLVSEVEMRNVCTFFRHGEATARATLLLLKMLHRLSQIPARNGDFLYYVPM